MKMEQFNQEANSSRHKEMFRAETEMEEFKKEQTLPEREIEGFGNTIEELRKSDNPIEKMKELKKEGGSASFHAFALYNFLKSDYPTPHSEIEKREDFFKEYREYWSNEDLLMISEDKKLPAWLSPMLMAMLPIEKENLTEKQKKEIVSIAIKSVCRMFETAEKGTEIWKRFRDIQIANGKSYADDSIEKEGKKYFHEGLVRFTSQNKDQFSLMICGKEYGFYPSDILRLLAKKNLLNWEDLLDENDRKNIKFDMEMHLKGVISGEIESKIKNDGPKSREIKSTDYSYPLSQKSKETLSQLFGSEKLEICMKHTGEGSSSKNFRKTGMELAPKFGRYQMPSIIKSLGWGEMPLNNFRLNFEIMNDEDPKKYDEVLSKIYAECFLKGKPVLSKITSGDLKTSKARILNYADYYSAIDLIKKIEERKSELPKDKLCSSKLTEKKCHLFPFGEDVPVHIRGTGETDLDSEKCEKELKDISKMFPSSKIVNGAV